MSHTSTIGICARAATASLMMAAAGCGAYNGGDGGTLKGGPDAAQSDGSTASDGGAPLPSGDQSVFAAIDVAVLVLDYDGEDYTAATPSEPPIKLGITSRIRINGGTGAGRVPGLRIFGDDVELSETSSAGVPPQFTFTSPSHDDPNRATILEFRYDSSSFAFLAEPLDVQFTAPAEGETIGVYDTFIVHWEGISAAPSTVFRIDGGPFGFSGGTCIPRFTLLTTEDNAATFTRDPGTAPAGSCEAEITATWSTGEYSVPSTPFHSFLVTRASRRIHRFRIMQQ